MSGIEVALIATAIGTATSVVGSIKQASAAKSAARFNSQVSLNNAATAKAAATENERRFRRTSAQRAGSLRARGASADLLADSAMEEELEALTIRHGGFVQSQNFTQQASLQRMQGRTAASSARFSAAGTLLKGAATGKGQYDKLPTDSPFRLT